MTVNASSTSSNPSHHVSLVVGSTTVGLNVKGFPKNFRQYPYSPSSLQFSTGRQGYGSFEPPYTSIDQTDFTGGLGQLKYEDTSKFYDSYNMWTLTDGVLMPAPLWRFAKGLRSENVFMPGDKLVPGADTTRSANVSWQAMAGTDNSRYLAHKFTGTAYDVENIWLLLRYYGTPGTLNVAIYADSSNPTSAVSNSTVSLTAANTSKAAPEGDLIGQLICFQPSTSPTLSATDFWVVVWCAATDNATNYWEVAYDDTNGGTAARSSNGTNWTATAARKIFYRAEEAVTNAKMHFIEYKRALYACSEPLDGSAGKICLNGDRGVATGTQSSVTLKDSTKSWTVDEWIGATAHIWNGTGEAQYRRITDNDTDTLTVSPAWDVTPVAGAADTGSEYNIIGTDKWQNVTPSGDNGVPAKPITDVLTLWGILYVAMGEADELHRFREWNDAATWKTFWGANSGTGTYGTDVADEETGNNALFLEKTYDPVNENFVWAGRNLAPGEWGSTTQTSVYKADDVTWGTDLTFGNPVPIGTRDFLITNMTVYNNKLWIGKEDSIWWVDYDGQHDRAFPLDVGLQAIVSPDNCKAMAAQNLYLLFGWAHSMERLYGNSLDDIGPWRGTGLVKRALGSVVHIEPSIGWSFEAIDGKRDKQSSLLALTNGWHTLFRAPSIITSAFSGTNNNPRIRNIKWQSVYGESATNYMWFDFGGDIMFMQMPTSSLNPAQDDDVYFAPECYIVQSQMDAGYAELEKHYEKARHVCNTVSGKLYLDYDVNPDIYNFSWTNATQTDNAPSYEYDLSQSRQRNAVIRTRISTSDISDTSKNNVLAIILDAFARKPVKYNWEMQIDLSDNRNTITGDIDFTQDTIMDQLRTWSGQAQAIAMRCTDSFADDSGSGRTVVVEPPSLFRSVWNKIMRIFKGTATVTLREL